MDRWITDREPAGLEPGGVLVAPITDPSCTPRLLPAPAVVVDVGAQVSHAVLVSRGLGIPCAVNVHGSSTTIPDGAVATVGGCAGPVTVIELSEG
jgi:rifampicin phosphotransferase